MIGGVFNRKARKAMGANARMVAAQLSRSVIDYDQSGQAVKVTDPDAQAVLRRAFERMLKAQGQAQVLRLSDREAAVFPRGGKVPAQGATAWLAVGVDRAGLATYALRWLDVSALDPVRQRALAEAVLFAELAVECARPGFPVAGHA
jgi:hypothetical protein